MLAFEPTVTAGAIIQTLILLAGIVAGWNKLNQDVAGIKIDIKALQSASEAFGRALEQLSSVLRQVAVQDVRILNIEKDVDELRHNKGFVND